MKIKTFTFNQFQENTFVISDNTRGCIIIDPGCYQQEEKDKLENYIIENNLKPIYLINTHCHIDHILGNNFISKRWSLDLMANKKDLDLLKNSQDIAKMYGFFNFESSLIILSIYSFNLFSISSGILTFNIAGPNTLKF